MDSFELKLLGAQFATFDGSGFNRFTYIPRVNSVNVTKNEDIFTCKNLLLYETMLCRSWYLKDEFYQKILLFYQVGSLAIIVAVYLNLTVNTANDSRSGAEID